MFCVICSCRVRERQELHQEAGVHQRQVREPVRQQTLQGGPDLRGRGTPAEMPRL